MKKCLLCHKRLGLIKFKSKDGYVCKNCYQIVSLNYQQTIRNKSKEELLQILSKVHEKDHDQVLNFQITRRIGEYILFDDVDHFLCLPNNRRFSPFKVKLKPEYYSFGAISSVKLLKEKRVKNNDKFCSLSVELTFSTPKLIKREIVLIPKPINVKSNIFHTMENLASKIIETTESVTEI